MKHPDKITIAILDAGVFPWWKNQTNSLANSYKEYYDQFEMEFIDYADTDSTYKNKPDGDHGFWVLDRVLQVCGNHDKVKIINGKVFSAKNSKSGSLINAISDVADKADIINFSLGIGRTVPYNDLSLFLDMFNAMLNSVVNKGGYAVISAGNEGERLKNGEVVENGNWLADDPDNNLSVASHSDAGIWDSYSSAGSDIDVSAVGSDLRLLGQKKVSTVSGTSFSAPSFTGLCGNYLIDQFSNLRSGDKTAKEIIDARLVDAIPPVSRKVRNFFRREPERSPWYGHGSYESYIKYMIDYYGRYDQRLDIFSRHLARSVEKEKKKKVSNNLQIM